MDKTMDRKAAEVFLPGEFILEELEARNWSQAELAEIMGRFPIEISGIISGKKAITPGIAKELAEAFGTSAQLWLNLESSYRLSRAKEVDSTIARRAYLYNRAPIREMIKRHWIEPSDNIEVLEHRVLQFFEKESLTDSFSLPYAARKGTEGLSPSHWAWIFRAKKLALAAPCARTFSTQSLKNAQSELKRLLPSAQETRQAPKILADAGIRFLVLEHLPQTRIDGVTLWLNAKAPVIALSLRYDRIDCFWYTLAHELGHVMRRDGMTQIMLDTAIFGQDAEAAESESEKAADSYATDFLINRSDIVDFIARVRPLYGTQRVVGFAKIIGVHPGIVVGQLQHRGEIGWSAFRPMLEKVRHIITQSALTDGWGHIAPPIN